MKRKILACVLACATMFLGMGYAFWTSSLQIDTTATTGDLNVKFCDMAIYGQYADENDGWAIFTGIPGSTTTGYGYHSTTTPNQFTPAMFFDRGSETNYNGMYNIIATAEDLAAYQNSVAKYTKTSFGAALKTPVTVVPAGADDVYGTGTNASDGINVTLSNLYPGYAQIFRTDVINVGTLAAKLSDIQLTLNSDVNADVADMIGVSLKVLTESGNAIKVLDTNDTSKYFVIDGVEFVRLSAINGLAISDAAGDDLLYIYPGANTVDAIFGVAMDPDYAGTYTTGHVGLASAKDDAATELESANFTMKFLWDQFNVANPTAVPGNTSIAE